MLAAVDPGENRYGFFQAFGLPFAQHGIVKRVIQGRAEQFQPGQKQIIHFLKKVLAVCLYGNSAAWSENITYSFHQALVDHLSFPETWLLVTGIREINQDPVNSSLAHHGRDRQVHVSVEQKKVGNMTESGKKFIRDLLANINTKEENILMDCCQTGRQFPLAATEIQAYLALPPVAIGVQPIVDTKDDPALERVYMSSNAIANTKAGKGCCPVPIVRLSLKSITAFILQVRGIIANGHYGKWFFEAHRRHMKCHPKGGGK